jgi:hypothetical protein
MPPAFQAGRQVPAKLGRSRLGVERRATPEIALSVAESHTNFTNEMNYDRDAGIQT